MCKSDYVQRMTFDSYLYKTGACPAGCLFSWEGRAVFWDGGTATAQYSKHLGA